MEDQRGLNGRRAWDAVVLGGGISGLTAARELQRAGLRTALVEKEPRLGGKVQTEEIDGFLIEAGPDAFIPHKPWAMELVRELGLEDRLLPSNDAVRATHVVVGSRLIELPPGLQMLTPRVLAPFLASPLLSWRAKMRVLAERWVPPRRAAAEDDESLASFVRRRMGEEVLDRLAEPLLAHIHVGDIERMSLHATYPRLAALEQQAGSLWKGARGTGAQARPGARPQAPTRSGPLFWALRGGLRELIEPLAKEIDPSCRFTAAAMQVRPSEDSANEGFDVVLEGETLKTRGVVLALPAEAAARLVPGERLRELLQTIRTVSIATLSLGYRVDDLPPLPRSFGFFVPRREQRNILAGTWTSTKFDHRAPQGHALLRVFLGGALHEDFLQKGDDDLIACVRRELQEILGLGAEPVLQRLVRWPKGYPQYDVGHPARVREIEAACPPGIAVAGSSFHGVGLPDCIRSGRQAAQNLRDALQY